MGIRSSRENIVRPILVSVAIAIAVLALGASGLVTSFPVYDAVVMVAIGAVSAAGFAVDRRLGLAVFVALMMLFLGTDLANGSMPIVLLAAGVVFIAGALASRRIDRGKVPAAQDASERRSGPRRSGW